MLGGIASGKSEVARAFAGTRGEVIEADRIAHEVLESPPLRSWIAARFGPELTAGQGVDRAALGARVFADPAARAELEARVHPQVRLAIESRIAAARARHASPIVLDIPLLLESDAAQHWTALCDALVFVDADAKVREARATARRGWPPGELARRESIQLPLDLKRARADVVIENDGDLDALSGRVAEALLTLEARRKPR